MKMVRIYIGKRADRGNCPIGNISSGDPSSSSLSVYSSDSTAVSSDSYPVSAEATKSLGDVWRASRTSGSYNLEMVR